MLQTKVVENIKA